MAEVGKSGNQLWAHCHFEVKREDPAVAGYDAWPYGRSADYVRQHYVRPADWWRRSWPGGPNTQPVNRRRWRC